ncbi:hypothetical protein AAE02nite_27460 [Adhaeribacter aerolatus]|uniref:Uncharacterized protein n=1 Tax=Adhaeribacter aerolatus TaxID=670289 RepID=A0A512AZD6_9BACT|nr:hypothetical protein [Adhaeribacter aerolatus]GEO05082.1 hypothetical protein AAE02nite_27460 [Adhaeribacter aerolatus]
MPTLVHLADEKNSLKIIKNGIKTGKYGNGVYCMPVLQNFYVSHQWLRELKRSGAKSYVGVYFKVPSAEMVFAGKYGQKHRHITLGEAIKEILSLADPLGYELILDRKIAPEEITKIRHLPQTLGWRYFPGSHNKKPCNCEYCLRGTIKGKKTQKRLNQETEDE